MLGARTRRFGIPMGILALLAAVLLLVPSIPNTNSSVHPNPTGTSSLSLPKGVTPPAAAGSSGSTVGGISCKPGVRQAPWSVYSPICIPAYHGNNGGPTTKGVTSSSIAFTYRLASAGALATIYSFLPKGVIGTNAEAVTTLQSYIKVFNQYFELYGRKVDLKTFNGVGNFIQELTGTGQVYAQQDALTEQDMGTFADDSLADSSPIFINDLASYGIISLTLWPPAKAWFTQEAPYAYATGLNCDKRSSGAAALVARELQGHTASFAGDPSLKMHRRSIAYVYQATPYESACEELFVTDLAKDHGTPVRLESYTFDFASFLNQTASIIARLKSSGVTTVVLAADPVSPTIFAQAADQQNYHPEWVMLPIFGNGYMNGDSLGRLPPQDQMANALSLGIADNSELDQEAYRVFKMGCSDPNTCDPLPPASLGIAYASMLMLFSGIQAAGPDLTPANFAKGIASLPGGPSSGMFGKWSFGPGSTDPASSYQILKWRPDMVSPLDSQKGTFVACNDGQQYLYSNPSSMPSGSPPKCPLN